MDNNTANIDENIGPEKGNVPHKYKEYGKKSLAPLVDLLHRYKGDIDPYVAALSKGLDGAINSFKEAAAETPGLDKRAQDAERAVQGWFRDASEWFNGAKQRLQSENPKELLNYLEEQGRKRPAVLFASSYVVGMIVGRLGRHVVRIKQSSTASSTQQETFH